MRSHFLDFLLVFHFYKCKRECSTERSKKRISLLSDVVIGIKKFIVKVSCLNQQIQLSFNLY